MGPHIDGNEGRRVQTITNIVVQQAPSHAVQTIPGVNQGAVHDHLEESLRTLGAKLDRIFSDTMQKSGKGLRTKEKKQLLEQFGNEMSKRVGDGIANALRNTDLDLHDKDELESTLSAIGDAFAEMDGDELQKVTKEPADQVQSDANDMRKKNEQEKRDRAAQRKAEREKSRRATAMSSGAGVSSSGGSWSSKGRRSSK